jgi:hypothetical protein
MYSMRRRSAEGEENGEYTLRGHLSPGRAKVRGEPHAVSAEWEVNVTGVIEVDNW